MNFFNLWALRDPRGPCNRKNKSRSKISILCQSQLAEKQHEQILLYNFGFLNLQCYFGEAVCTGLFRTDFLHGFVSHGFFCTDFLHGFSARIFCTDFFARIFCTDFLHGFLPDSFARISARIACKNCLYRCCTDFCTEFFGVSQNTSWEAPKFHRENPPKNSPCFGGLLGRGSGGKRVR